MIKILFPKKTHKLKLFLGLSISSPLLVGLISCGVFTTSEQAKREGAKWAAEQNFSSMFSTFKSRILFSTEFDYVEEAHSADSAEVRIVVQFKNWSTYREKAIKAVEDFKQFLLESSENIHVTDKFAQALNDLLSHFDGQKEAPLDTRNFLDKNSSLITILNDQIVSYS
ncbi:hypothetical protein EI74_0452 [Mycoplasma testudineum]|uniref:Lipoprotein n=1 Tax=Mycoplasma testudineum TaxID=244584 RepID=A0A4R6IEH0_9MOLU|nr:hypothetical protein [Mycoplasma testudineum]OYD26840.1 hypothetical protein CG473_01880 [Mycoplasma testudineum]TDO20374.1 hypothetical protein EI74_0452 [Mycoplasma testudineum]